jgi:hypothetical protein
MQMYRIIYALLCLSVLLGSCVDKADEEARKKRRAISEEMKQRPFAGVIDSIEHRVGDFPSHILLYNDETLWSLNEHPDFFVDSVVNCLGEEHSRIKKEIANFILRDLPEKKFMAVVERTAVLYKEGKIESKMMANILFLPQSSHHYVAGNNKNPEVKSMLIEVRDNPRSDGALRDQVGRVLAGDGD